MAKIIGVILFLITYFYSCCDRKIFYSKYPHRLGMGDIYPQQGFEIKSTSPLRP